jgi:hypothetical protein
MAVGIALFEGNEFGASSGSGDGRGVDQEPERQKHYSE